MGFWKNYLLFYKHKGIVGPLYNVLKAEVMKTDYAQVDETTVLIIDNGKNLSLKFYY